MSAIHDFCPFHGREFDFRAAIHDFARFHGRDLHFMSAVHDFAHFYGRELSLLLRCVVGLMEKCKFVLLLNYSGSPSMIKWQGNEVRD